MSDSTQNFKLDLLNGVTKDLQAAVDALRVEVLTLGSLVQRIDRVETTLDADRARADARIAVLEKTVAEFETFKKIGKWVLGLIGGAEVAQIEPVAKFLVGVLGGGN